MTDSEEIAGVKVDQIDHVELVVPDRHQAAQWYLRVLGLKVVSGFEQWADDPRGPLMISSDGGSTKLALFQGERPGSKEAGAFQLVAFRVGAVEFGRFLDRLSELNLTNYRGQRVTADLVVDHGASYSIYFCDSSGNQLELTTYQHDEAKAIFGR